MKPVVLVTRKLPDAVATRDALGYRALDNLGAFFAGRDPRDRVA